MKTCNICGATADDKATQCPSCGFEMPIAPSTTQPNPQPRDILEAWASLKISAVQTMNPYVMLLHEMLANFESGKVADLVQRVNNLISQAKGQGTPITMTNPYLALWATALNNNLKRLQ